jgi:hypothetical protein
MQAWKGFPAEIPIAGIPTRLMEGIKGTIDNEGKPTEREWLKFAEAASIALALPYSQGKRAYKAVRDDNVWEVMSIRPSTKSEDELAKAKKKIINWKKENTPEGREADLKPLAYQILDMERLGDEEKLVRTLTNRYFAMARKNKVSMSRANRLLKNLRRKSGKQLKKLLSSKDWRGYKATLSPREQRDLDELLRLVESIDKNYYNLGR